MSSISKSFRFDIFADGFSKQMWCMGFFQSIFHGNGLVFDGFLPFLFLFFSFTINSRCSEEALKKTHRIQFIFPWYTASMVMSATFGSLITFHCAYMWIVPISMRFIFGVHRNRLPQSGFKIKTTNFALTIYILVLQSVCVEVECMCSVCLSCLDFDMGRWMAHTLFGMEYFVWANADFCDAPNPIPIHRNCYHMPSMLSVCTLCMPACLPACCGRFSGGWFVFVLVCSFWMSAHCVEFTRNFTTTRCQVLRARSMNKIVHATLTHSHNFSLIKLRSLQFTIRVEHMTYFLINIHALSHSDIQATSVENFATFLPHFWCELKIMV